MVHASSLRFRKQNPKAGCYVWQAQNSILTLTSSTGARIQDCPEPESHGDKSRDIPRQRRGSRKVIYWVSSPVFRKEILGRLTPRAQTHRITLPTCLAIITSTSTIVLMHTSDLPCRGNGDKIATLSDLCNPAYLIVIPPNMTFSLSAVK